MELRHLRLVRTLTREGTLTAAARHLHLSQPALSHQLREIQEEMGAPLFQRARKRMVLTEAGRRVLEGAETILLEMESVEADVARLASGEGGTLRIATACYTGYHWLPSILRAFRRRYPRVNVKVNLAATRNPIASLLEGQLDLAILNRRDPEPSIQYRKLFDDEMIVLVYRDHPWTRRTYVRPEEFAGETVINYDLPDEEIFFLRDVLAPAGVVPQEIMKLPTTDAVIEMVKAEMGVAVQVEWAVRSYLRSSRLRSLRLTRRGVKRPWYVARLKSSGLSYVSDFVDHLTAHVRSR